MSRASRAQHRPLNWATDDARGLREAPRPGGERRLQETLRSSSALRSASIVLRVAIYARYSSEKQNWRSIPDQFLYCRDYAERQVGWKVVREFHDAELTGDTLLLRPGVQALLAAAKRKEFDIVLVEDMDRLSRRPSELNSLYERFTFADVTLHEVGGGEADDLRVGIKSIVNSQFLKNLRNKIHRNGHARAVDGKSAGPARYGYRIVRHIDENGDPIRGDREIDPVEAEIVVRILTEYAAGEAPSRIVKRLNEEGIPGPRGHKWTPMAIIGGKSLGAGKRDW